MKTRGLFSSVLAVLSCYHLSVWAQPAQTGWIDSTKLQKTINDLANDALGASLIQTTFDNAGFTYSPVDGAAVLQELSDKLEAKVKAKQDAVKKIQQAIEAEYSNYGPANPFQQCCEVNANEYSNTFKKNVAKTACTHISPGAPVPTKYLNQATVDVMLQNNKDYPELLLQKVGTTEGLRTVVPAAQHLPCNHSLDVTKSPWFVQAVTTAPKDVVIVLDISASMLEVERLDIAKEAAIEAINSLLPMDRVGLVAFNTKTTHPPGNDKLGDCFKDKLALATPDNIEYLESFINDLSAIGDTDYGVAITAAFNFFDDAPTDKVILFVSDGQPTDLGGPAAILNTVQVLNCQRENKVLIYTYGLGRGINNVAASVLSDMASQTNADTSCGPVMVGNFTLVKDNENLKGPMSSYLYGLPMATANVNPKFVAPIMYEPSQGLTMKYCVPAFSSGKIVAVACAGVSVADLVADVTYFQEGRYSYAFLVDKMGLTLMHPLLYRPFDATEDPPMVMISDLERDDGAESVLESMMQMGNGSKTFESTHIFARGHTKTAGVDAITISSTYTWQRIPGTPLSICVVVGQGDATIQYTKGGSTDPKFVYTNIDKMTTTPPGMCVNYGALATKSTSTVLLARTAFENPVMFLAKPETTTEVEGYAEYILNASYPSQGLKPQVREMVWLTGALNDFYKNSFEKYGPYLTVRYIGTSNGLIRTFPGHALPSLYDPSVREWYKIGVAHPGATIIAPPAVDASGNVLHTIAKSINSGKVSGQSQFPIAVVGAHFTSFYLGKLVLDLFSQCAGPDYSCFLVDTNAILITHPDFLVLDTTAADVSNIPLMAKEPDLANTLIAEGLLTRSTCMDFSELVEWNTWRLSLRQTFQTSDYYLQFVEDTNLILGIKINNRTDSTTCACASEQVCGQSCECPCMKPVADFNACENRVPLSGPQPPTCAPSNAYKVQDPMILDQLKKRKDMTKNLDPCFQSDCGKQSAFLDCMAVLGCSWCGLDETQPQKKTCNTIKQCQGPKLPDEGDGDGNGDGAEGSGDRIWIVIVAVIAGILGLLVLAGLIYCCCRGDKYIHPTTANNVHNPTYGSKMQPQYRGGGQSLFKESMKW